MITQHGTVRRQKLQRATRPGSLFYRRTYCNKQSVKIPCFQRDGQYFVYFPIIDVYGNAAEQKTRDDMAAFLDHGNELVAETAFRWARDFPASAVDGTIEATPGMLRSTPRNLSASTPQDWKQLVNPRGTTTCPAKRQEQRGGRSQLCPCSADDKSSQGYPGLRDPASTARTFRGERGFIVLAVGDKEADCWGVQLLFQLMNTPRGCFTTRTKA